MISTMIKLIRRCRNFYQTSDSTNKIYEAQPHNYRNKIRFPSNDETYEKEGSFCSSISDNCSLLNHIFHEFYMMSLLTSYDVQITWMTEIAL